MRLQLFKEQCGYEVAKAWCPIFNLNVLSWILVAGILFFWIFEFVFNRCECGEFYHTKEERKVFIIKLIITSVLMIIAGLVNTF